MQENKLPKRIDCTLAYEKKPVADLMLLAEFTTVRKNSYAIVSGPSDQQGKVTITYEEIKRQADSQLELALMDFDPIDKAFSGEISVKVMSYDDIQDAISAYDLFKSVGWYPANYHEHLEKASQILQEIDAASIEVAFVVTPG
jgi:hypothetical protein